MGKCTKLSVNLKAYDLITQHQAILKYIFLFSKKLIHFGEQNEKTLCDFVHVKKLQLFC